MLFKNMLLKKPRRRFWPLWILAALFTTGVLALGRPRVTPGAALDLSKPAAEIPVLRNRAGELLMFNFRAVEPNILYRSSGFPRNKIVAENGVIKKAPSAFSDAEFFLFLKKHRIRTVVTLQESEYFWAEQGYFQWWEKQSGYKISLVSLPVEASRAYGRDAHSALHAATLFLKLMKNRKPAAGAVLLHCDAGKDRTGIVVAAYELWRNQGKLNKDELWRLVRARYLESNAEIRRDNAAAAWAGAPQICKDCGGGKAGEGWVCGEWFDRLRPDLERLAQL